MSAGEIETMMMNKNPDFTFTGKDDQVTSIVNEVSTTNQQNNNENLRCFVCDSKVQGRRYSLATCKTQNSRTRVVEKLGELVGERYVVVINEDDVICRSCANLINTLDRLEFDMKKVKGSVLRFLECKYSLTEGELLKSADPPKLGQPPHITRNDNSQIGDYHSRKREAPLDDNEKDRKNKKSIWMQCDKCKYTSNYDTFMAHHVRQHLKRKTQSIKYGDHLVGPNSIKHRCKDTGSGNNYTETENLGKEPQPIQTAPLETVDLTGTVDDVDTGGNLPILTIQPDLKTLGGSVKDDQIELISLTNSNGLQFQNFLSNEGSLREGQPMLMRVLQQLEVNEDLNELPLQQAIPVTSNDNGIVLTTSNSSTKQMLTLAEDGSLEMVAVDWSDVNSVEPDSHIHF